MSITTVKATINGVEHNLTYNSATQKWEATLTAPSLSSFNQAGGYYGVILSAQDNAGNTAAANANTSSIGASLRLTVKEKVPPTVTIVSPGASAYLTDNTPAITAQLRDADSGIKITTLALKIDGGTAIGSASPGMVCTPVSGGYDLTYTAQAVLADGAHTITVDAQDNDGNAAAQGTRSFSIGTTAPVLNVTSPADGFVTNQKAGTVSGATSDATSGGVVVAIKVNNVDVGAVTVEAAGAFSKAVSYVEGANTVSVTATDRAGKSTSVTRTVTLNTIAPVFQSVELVPNPVDAGLTYLIKVSVS